MSIGPEPLDASHESDDGALSESDFRVDRWPASVAVLVCVGLYLVLPNQLTIQPKWLIPALELAVLIPLGWRRHRHLGESRWVRPLTIALLALISVANVISVELLVHHLLRHGPGSPTNGRTLVYSAALIWLTNVIVFSLWFWELDRGGPTKRFSHLERYADFQFPQMENPKLAQPGWRPRYLDYLYVSLTNAAAFSPTDAMPLTRTAKVLMGIESVSSMVTVVVVAARAVNILQ